MGVWREEFITTLPRVWRWVGVCGERSSLRHSHEGGGGVSVWRGWEYVGRSSLAHTPNWWRWWVGVWRGVHYLLIPPPWGLQAFLVHRTHKEPSPPPSSGLTKPGVVYSYTVDTTQWVVKHSLQQLNPYLYRSKVLVDDHLPSECGIPSCCLRIPPHQVYSRKETSRYRCKTFYPGSLATPPYCRQEIIAVMSWTTVCYWYS